MDIVERLLLLADFSLNSSPRFVRNRSISAFEKNFNNDLRLVDEVAVKAAEEIIGLRDTLENILKIPNSEAAQGIIKVLARAALGFDDRRRDDRGDNLDGN
jgi:hypothetical protein